MPKAGTERQQNLDRFGLKFSMMENIPRKTQSKVWNIMYTVLKQIGIMKFK